jgi:hypothetical protein
VSEPAYAGRNWAAGVLENAQSSLQDALDCTEAVESHDARMDRLSKKVSDALGTPYSVFAERSAARREYDVVARCNSCHLQWQLSLTEDAIESVPLAWDVRIEAVIGGTLSARKVFANEKDICMCVDGMTQARLLALYEGNQRTDMPWSWSPNGGFMTARQRDAARMTWSAELKRKQSAAREKERCQVVCDEQWGEDV